VAEHNPMPGVEERERSIAALISNSAVADWFQDVLEARGAVNGLAPGVGQLELQTVGEALLKRCLKRVVVGVADGILSEDAGKDRDAIAWTAPGKGLSRRIPSL